MKLSKPFIGLVMIILVLALALPARAVAAVPGMLILGDTYTLASGELLDENLTILGGNVVIEQDATVDGDILLLGGTLRMDGIVEGDISAAGGVLELGETAQVKGDISTAGASLRQAEGAQINGKIITETGETVSNLRSRGLNLPALVNQVLTPLAFLVRVLVMAALAVLAVMFLPQPVERVAQTLVSQPVLSGGMGILTIIVFPLAFILTVVSILFIPLGLLGLLTLGILYLYGLIAVGYEVGRRIAAMFHWDWAAPVIAGVGTLAISLVLGGLGQIPCLGWLISFLVWHWGLGAVILTRFGTQPYVEGGFPARQSHLPVPPLPPPAEEEPPSIAAEA